MLTRGRKAIAANIAGSPYALIDNRSPFVKITR